MASTQLYHLKNDHWQIDDDNGAVFSLETGETKQASVFLRLNEGQAA